MAATGRGRRPARTGDARGAALEWIAAAVSAAIVLALLGALLREATRASASPPDLRLTLAEPTPLEGGAHVRFTLANRGGRTAASVAVALQLRDGGAVVDTRRLTVGYVPGHSEVTGGFYLDAPPPGLTPTAVVEGYVDP